MNNLTLWSNSSLTASKFNLRTKPSTIKTYADLISFAIPCLLVAFIVFYIWQSWVALIAIIILGLMFHLGFRYLPGKEQSPALLAEKYFFCDDQGALSLGAKRQWQILQQSKVTPWGCCLCLATLQPTSRRAPVQTVWIYPDMLANSDYRQLCRILTTCRDTQMTHR